jgi:hypothetical protein
MATTPNITGEQCLLYCTRSNLTVPPELRQPGESDADFQARIVAIAEAHLAERNITATLSDPVLG